MQGYAVLLPAVSNQAVAEAWLWCRAPVCCCGYPVCCRSCSGLRLFLGVAITQPHCCVSSHAGEDCVLRGKGWSCSHGSARATALLLLLLLGVSLFHGILAEWHQRCLCLCSSSCCHLLLTCSAAAFHHHVAHWWDCGVVRLHSSNHNAHCGCCCSAVAIITALLLLPLLPLAKSSNVLHAVCLR